MNIASVTDLTTINEDLLRFLDLQKLVYVCQIWIGEKGQIGSLSSNSGSDAGSESEPTEQDMVIAQTNDTTIRQSRRIFRHFYSIRI